MKRLFSSFTWKIVLYLVSQYSNFIRTKAQEKRFQEGLEEHDVSVSQGKSRELIQV